MDLVTSWERWVSPEENGPYISGTDRGQMSTINFTVW